MGEVILSTSEELNNSSASFDWQPLFDYLTPYIQVFIFLFAVVIGLLIVQILAKGWDSNGI